MLSNFTPNFGSNFQPSGGFDDIMLGGDNIYPTLDAFFAHDKAFEVNPASPGGCLITSRLGPDAKFSRASGRTFTDSDGLVKWAVENLFVGSGIITGLLLDNITSVVTAPVDGPLGESDSQEISYPAVTGANSLVAKLVGFSTQAGSPLTISDWVRSDTPTEIIFGFFSPADTTYYASVFPVTTEWTRIEINHTALFNEEMYFVLGVKMPGHTVATTEARVVYRRNIQFERHSSARTYLPTTSAPVYGPAFEHDPVTGVCLGLSRWEQRTNLLLNSETLATQSVTVAAVAHTLSFYGTGTVTLSGAHVASVVGTGVYPSRRTITFTPTAGSLTCTVTGTVQKSNLEPGSSASPWIPTTTAPVVRSADVCDITGSDFAGFYNQSEGTVVVTFTAPLVGTTGVFSINNGTASERLEQSASGTNPQFVAVDGGVIQSSLDAGTLIPYTTHKLAISWKANEFATCLDGGAVVTDTSGTMPTPDRLLIGITQAGESLNGEIARLEYRPKALPAKLQTLSI